MIDIVAKNKVAIGLLVVAAILRFYRFTEFVTFLGDQGRDAVIVKRIVTLEHFPAIGPTSSVGGVFLGPFFYYLIAPFLLIFNFNPVGLAFASALFSLAGMALGYFIVRKLTDTLTALIFLFFIVFSSTQIDFARSSWNPNLLPVFAFLTIYLWYKTLTSRRLIFAFLFGMMASFSLQLHYLALFLLASFALWWLKEMVVEKNKGELLKKTAVSIISFIFFSSPLIIFDLKHGFINSKAFLKAMTNKDVVNSSSPLLRIYETNAALYSHVFQITVDPRLALLATILIIIGLLSAPSFKKNIFLQINAVCFFFYLLAFSMLNSFRLSHYYASVYYSFFLLIGFSLTRFAVIPKIARYVFIVGILGIFVYFNSTTYYYFKNRGSNQIQIARTIAQSLLDHHPKDPYQIVPVPFTETDGHIRYFLELGGHRPLPEESNAQPQELYILCYEKDCSDVSAPQWQIASFKNGRVGETWRVDRLIIYKVVHGT